MTRILTVDDSRAVRSIVAKQLAPLDFEIGEAEDGNDGLKKLEASPYDLVILDVTMPNLDGPGMLTKLRENGDKTPVLMLTSESKTAIVAALVRLGIADYVLKPFKGDELKAKVLKALKLPADYASPGGASAVSAPASQSAPHVLSIDDMDTVHKKLRSMVPESVKIDSALNASDGLAAARSKKYRAVLIDSDLPDTVMPTLTKQLRLLQPNAVLLALALRTANNVAAEVKSLGFDDVMLKPFTAKAIDALVEKCIVGNEELLHVAENSIKVVSFHDSDDRLETYFKRLTVRLTEVLNKLAEGCYDSAVVDASQIPLQQPLWAAQFVTQAGKVSGEVGISLRLVGAPELSTNLGRFEETKDIRFFASIEEAKAAA